MNLVKQIIDDENFNMRAQPMVGIGAGSACNIGDSEIPWTMDDTV